MTNEIWKPVVGYEGRYEVSNEGRVRSLPKYRTKETKVLKPYVNTWNGYCYVQLSDENHNHKSHRVHKLVLEAFTDYRSTGFNPPYNVINHIDENKTNNRLENLEVCSQYENLHKSSKYKVRKAGCEVRVINLDNKEVYESYTDAAKAIGGSRGEMVARVCRGERSHYRNYRFAKLEDYENGTIPEYKGKNKKKASESLWR